MKEPRLVLAELGTMNADDVEVRVSDLTATVRYLVLLSWPEGTEGFTGEELESLVNRDAMIGVCMFKFEKRCNVTQAVVG